MKKMGTVLVLGLKDKAPKNVDLDITPVSTDGEWSQLSPFHLGPCRTPDGVMFLNFENLWQYSKVYREHMQFDSDLLCGEINSEWFMWHLSGARTKRGIRYPMGKGKKADFSKWGNLRLSYIAARKQIYVPEYSKLMLQTPKFRKLKKQFNQGANIVIRDYDTYDAFKAYKYKAGERHPFLQALNNPDKKFGHSFCIGMALMLQNTPSWYEQWVI